MRLTPQYPEFRADATFDATVRDAETPVDRLKYEWSATLGTIVGNGSRATWRADQPPPTQSPLGFDVTLKVTEDLPSGTSQSVTRTMTATMSDSYKEARDLANAFLTDFTNPNASPAFVVRNFTDFCREKQEELDNVVDNRRLFIIDPVRSTWAITSVTFDQKLPTTGTFGNVAATCNFVSLIRATNQTQVATGTCFLDVFFEAPRWRLCDSHFNGTHADFPPAPPSLHP